MDQSKVVQTQSKGAMMRVEGVRTSMKLRCRQVAPALAWLLVATVSGAAAIGANDRELTQSRLESLLGDPGIARRGEEGDGAAQGAGSKGSNSEGVGDVSLHATARKRARRQAETVDIVGTAGVFAQASGTLSVDVAYSTAMSPGTANVRCILRAFMPDGSRQKFFNDVVVLLNGQTGTVTCSFTAANYVGTTDAWNNAMAVLW
jgi:hypothetical protein